MRKEKIWQLLPGCYHVEESWNGGKNRHKRLKEGVSVWLCCVTNTHKNIHDKKCFFLLSICKPPAALLEAVDLWSR